MENLSHQYLVDMGARVLPVVRLGLHVDGGPLLTNDPVLANRIIHPRYQIPKVYHAVVCGHVLKAAL